jgi:hypothetical protein
VKRLGELTTRDLKDAPVWRYEGGDGPAAVVSPARHARLSQSDDEIYLAATEFELFDGTSLTGFCFPADDSGLDYLQPAIVTDAGHVSFWFDRPVTPAELDRQWQRLGKSEAEILPATFRCLVPVDGRTVSGRIARVETAAELSPAGPEPPALEVSSPAASERVPTARPLQARRDTGPVEKRTSRRRKAEMEVEFTQDGVPARGVIGDLSPRGMFVRSSRIPGTGPNLRLTVNLPNGRKLVLTGKVVRTVMEASARTGKGFGLRLAGESPEYDELLLRLRNKPHS